MSKWSDIYLERVGFGYREYCKRRYDAFIARLMVERKQEGQTNYAEEGCGIGTFSAILNCHPNIEIVGMSDIDDDMVKLAKKNCPELANIITTQDMNIQKYEEKPDIIFSHGVLEHFDDASIKTIIDRQVSDAKLAVIHYVPTSLYLKKSIGDERLLPLSYWYDLTKFTEVFTFNEDRDAILIWRKQ